jgi:hypothetical protein
MQGFRLTRARGGTLFCVGGGPGSGTRTRLRNRGGTPGPLRMRGQGRRAIVTCATRNAEGDNSPRVRAVVRLGRPGGRVPPSLATQACATPKGSALSDRRLTRVVLSCGSFRTSTRNHRRRRAREREHQAYACAHAREGSVARWGMETPGVGLYLRRGGAGTGVAAPGQMVGQRKHGRFWPSTSNRWWQLPYNT